MSQHMYVKPLVYYRSNVFSSISAVYILLMLFVNRKGYYRVRLAAVNS